MTARLRTPPAWRRIASPLALMLLLPAPSGALGGPQVAEPRGIAVQEPVQPSLHVGPPLPAEADLRHRPIRQPAAKAARQAAGGIPSPGRAGGALRPIEALPLDGAKLLAGEVGIALAWAGGQPPFEVTVATGKGEVLARKTVRTREVRFPDLVVPAVPLVVTLHGAGGQEMAARLNPERRLPAGFPAAAAVAAPVAHAIALYEEGGPEWRLEALRRLLARASRDPLAAWAARRMLDGSL